MEAFEEVSEASVEVEGLNKVFPARVPVVALEDLSFIARPGEVFGLLGPNGAGKTTCFRILATIIKPTSGKIRIGGLDLLKEPDEVRKRIGYITGSTNIYDRLTAREMVEYFGRLHGMEDSLIRKRIGEIFSLFEMDAFGDTYCGQLSAGTKQKVSLARALIHDPDILIFDEPTAGLDVIVARTVLDLIRQFTREQKCILFSTHLLLEAETICDRIAIIHKGRILIQGNLKELKERTGLSSLEEIFFSMLHESQSEASLK